MRPRSSGATRVPPAGNSPASAPYAADHPGRRRPRLRRRGVVDRTVRALRWQRLRTMREIAATVMRGANGDHVVLGPVTRDASGWRFAVAVAKRGERHHTTVGGTLDEGERDLAKLRGRPSPSAAGSRSTWPTTRAPWRTSSRRASAAEGRIRPQAIGDFSAKLIGLRHSPERPDRLRKQSAGTCHRTEWDGANDQFPFITTRWAVSKDATAGVHRGAW
jgi:hypothetical protein